MEERRKEALAANNKANARAMRESTWKAMELALEQKKCKYIGKYFFGKDSIGYLYIIFHNIFNLLSRHHLLQLLKINIHSDVC
jgi:hypothetical protein